MIFKPDQDFINSDDMADINDSEDAEAPILSDDSEDEDDGLNVAQRTRSQIRQRHTSSVSNHQA